MLDEKTKAMVLEALNDKYKARCILCHNGPNFTDNQFHNLGVPQVGPMKEDLGRFYVTRQERDKGAFKTPTLRSITETAPYMHDGVFKTLEEVVDFLDQGGGQNPNLSQMVKPFDCRLMKSRSDRVLESAHRCADQVRDAEVAEVVGPLSS